MINELTKSQELLMSEVRDKWIKRGLSTEKFTISGAQKIVGDLNTHILKGKERPVFVFNSPIECWYFICLMETNKNLQVESQVESQVRS